MHVLQTSRLEAVVQLSGQLLAARIMPKVLILQGLQPQASPPFVRIHLLGTQHPSERCQLAILMQQAQSRFSCYK